MPTYKSLALPDCLREGAHGLFEGDIEGRAVGIKDIDVVETHAREAFIKGGKQVLARATQAVGAGPHIPTGFG
jgi:hypothetical protein